MTNIMLHVPDQLLHRWRRTFPRGDLGAVLRATMLAQVKEHEMTEERERWDRAGVPVSERPA